MTTTDLERPFFDLVIGWSQDSFNTDLRGLLGSSWGGLGPLLGALGRSLEGLGGLLSRLEGVLGSLGTVLAAHEAINGSFWNATR